MAQRAKRQPAESVEKWALHRIRPYGQNPRTHSHEQIALLAGLMTRYGIDQPIVVDEKGIILKGHGRLAAAARAGFKTYPVVVRRGMSESDKRALRIADNQVALLSGWDDELIKLEVSELKLDGFELPMLGFSERELARFVGATEADAALPQLAGLSYAVVVRCKNETEQRDLLERFEKEGLTVEALIS